MRHALFFTIPRKRLVTSECYTGAMLPSRPAQIFRNRWSAIRWAAGVIFFAVTTIGFAPSKASHSRAHTGQESARPIDAAGEPIDNEDMALIANLIG